MTLLLLICCHYLCDFPLQGEFVSKHKVYLVMLVMFLIKHGNKLTIGNIDIMKKLN